MKKLRWDFSKSEQLKTQRGASFEDLLQSKLVAIKEHPGKKHQNIMLFEYQEYIWVVPFVFEDEEVFLKTLFPSRKYTKLLKRVQFHETSQIKPEEKAIEKDLLKGQFLDVSPETFEEVAQAIAARKKDTVISIRLNRQDLEKIKKKAKKYGIRYQTLISECIHRIARG